MSKRSKIIILIVGILLSIYGWSGLTHNTELRTWTVIGGPNNGRKVEAEFVSNSDGQVSLKLKSGKVVKVHINHLSKKDNEYIHEGWIFRLLGIVLIIGPFTNFRFAKYWTAKVSLLIQGKKLKQNNPVGEVKPELEGVNMDQLENREGIQYLSGSDTPYTGKFFELYDNGQKSMEGNFKYGKYDGLYVFWHENGQKSVEGNFKDGKKDGLVTSWLENGQKSMEGHWKEDKWHGLWVVWHENGQKWFEEIYKDGKMVEGSAKYWNSKGEPVDSEEEAFK